MQAKYQNKIFQKNIDFIYKCHKIYIVKFRLKCRILRLLWGRSIILVLKTDANENIRFNRPDEFRSNKGFNSERNRSYRHYSTYEDEEEYGSQQKGRKNSDGKCKSHMSDDIELPDKLESIKRFEREKKAVQKKNREEETERRKKPVMKQKRSTKDWTRDYEYGLLDDEEVFM